MSDYFDFSTGRLSVGTTARSSEVNNLFDAIDTGLDKLPSETHLKRGLVNYAVAGGTENALTLTLPYAPSLYTDGMEVLFKAGYTNTLPATININSLGAKSIRRQDGTALVAGDIVLAKIFTLRYNSTSDYFEIQGSPVGSAGTGTMSTQNAAAVSITGGTMDDVTITSSEPITFNSHQDTDGDTKVQVEEGSDDDTIRFDTGGTERVTITTTKVTSNIPVQFNSHQDTDGDTKVQVEESADEDKVRVDTGGTERVVIDSSGLDVVSGSILKGGTDIRDTVETLTNKRLTSPKINEDVALSASATQLDTAATAVGNATATPTANRIAMFNASGLLNGTFASGTKMLFNQTSAPTGWTKSTTHNDKALRVVSGTADSGGSVAFTTVFGSAMATSSAGGHSHTVSVGATTLTTTEMPSHTHTGGVPGLSPDAGTLPDSGKYNVTGGGSSTGSTGGGGSHTHSGSSGSDSGHSHTSNLAVQYVDIIIATKD